MWATLIIKVKHSLILCFLFSTDLTITLGAASTCRHKKEIATGKLIFRNRFF